MVNVLPYKETFSFSFQIRKLIFCGALTQSTMLPLKWRSNVKGFLCCCHCEHIAMKELFKFLLLLFKWKPCSTVWILALWLHGEGGALYCAGLYYLILLFERKKKKLKENLDPSQVKVTFAKVKSYSEGLHYP